MAAITISCIDKRYKGGAWQLELTEEAAALIDADGKMVTSIPHQNAEARFVLPSFWESIRNLGIKTDDGNIIWFSPEQSKVRAIKEYLNTALAIQGPEAIAKQRKSGLLHLSIGVVVTTLAIILMVGSMVLAFGNPQGGTYYVTFGAMVFGLIELSRGVIALRRARKASESAGGEL